MVEGPGVRLSTERLARLRGETVKQSNCLPPDKESSLSGRQVLRVDCLGKELFVLFCHAEGSASAAAWPSPSSPSQQRQCLRIHFGMDGSCRLVNPSPPAPSSAGKGYGSWKKLTLEVEFTSGAILRCYDCTHSFRLQAEVEETLARMRSLDVCVKEGFDVARAASLVSEQGDRPLCDVLLDQAVLPGVGNIIKNEALLDARLRPATPVSDLSPQECQRLVRATRAFTLTFYDCRRRGKSLNPFYRVYEKDGCGKCRQTVVRTRMGEHARMTFYCPSCQLAPGGGTAQVPMGLQQTPKGFGIPPPSAAPAKTAAAAPQGAGTRAPHRNALEAKVQRCACGAPCVRKVARKPGPNQGRPFMACAKQKGCGVFLWADKRFPKCGCKGSCGKPAVVRRVLKEGANNGRHFYACPGSKQEQCGFFAWVDCAK